MKILPLQQEIEDYLAARNLTHKFFKQKTLFETNPFHPSLNTELLEPREMRIWSFRIDRKYRAIFIFHDSTTVEIVDINIFLPPQNFLLNRRSSEEVVGR